MLTQGACMLCSSPTSHVHPEGWGPNAAGASREHRGNDGGRAPFPDQELAAASCPPLEARRMSIAVGTIRIAAACFETPPRVLVASSPWSRAARRDAASVMAANTPQCCRR